MIANKTAGSKLDTTHPSHMTIQSNVLMYETLQVKQILQSQRLVYSIFTIRELVTVTTEIILFQSLKLHSQMFHCGRLQKKNKSGSREPLTALTK